MPEQPVKHIKICKVNGLTASDTPDLLAVEEPLEVRVGHGTEHKRTETSLAVTMRTPGEDKELAVGLLTTEGIINSLDDLISIKHCESAKQPENTIRAELDYDVHFDIEKYKRNFLSSSSCGICGKAYLESIKNKSISHNQNKVTLNSNMLYGLSNKLTSEQTIFKHTGGLHAAALFDTSGNLIASREDIGRHNALDKLIGSIALKEIRLNDKFVFLSGRIGFELVQKCLVAGIGTIVALGAPSSLALEMAQEYKMCLIGFLKPSRFNIYSGKEHIVLK